MQEIQRAYIEKPPSDFSLLLSLMILQFHRKMSLFFRDGF